jgi:hypothetical protein
MKRSIFAVGEGVCVWCTTLSHDHSGQAGERKSGPHDCYHQGGRLISDGDGPKDVIRSLRWLPVHYYMSSTPTVSKPRCRDTSGNTCRSHHGHPSNRTRYSSSGFLPDGSSYQQKRKKLAISSGVASREEDLYTCMRLMVTERMQRHVIGLCMSPQRWPSRGMVTAGLADIAWPGGAGKADLRGG